MHETRSSLILNYLFADNDVTMQWLPLSGKFVHFIRRIGITPGLTGKSQVNHLGCDDVYVYVCICIHSTLTLSTSRF